MFMDLNGSGRDIVRFLEVPIGDHQSGCVPLLAALGNDSCTLWEPRILLGCACLEFRIVTIEQAQASYSSLKLRLSSRIDRSGPS
jgi:hypothetical protein